MSSNWPVKKCSFPGCDVMLPDNGCDTVCNRKHIHLVGTEENREWREALASRLHDRFGSKCIVFTSVFEDDANDAKNVQGRIATEYANYMLLCQTSITVDGKAEQPCIVEALVSPSREFWGSMTAIILAKDRVKILEREFPLNQILFKQEIRFPENCESWISARLGSTVPLTLS